MLDTPNHALCNEIVCIVYLCNFVVIKYTTLECDGSVAAEPSASGHENLQVCLEPINSSVEVDQRGVLEGQGNYVCAIIIIPLITTLART